MKYLIDLLIRLEEGHQDALSPVALDVSNSYLREDELLKPATKDDVCQLADLVDRTQQTASNVAITMSTRHLPSGPSAMVTQIPNIYIASSANICVPSNDHRKRLPIPGVTIPNIGRSQNTWREAVKQWEQGDPTKNLCALKDWPPEWYSGVMRPLTGSKRQIRRLIAEEYE